jgi:hypothetical protein
LPQASDKQIPQSCARDRARGKRGYESYQRLCAIRGPVRGLGYLALWPLTAHDNGIAALGAAFIRAALTRKFVP